MVTPNGVWVIKTKYFQIANRDTKLDISRFAGGDRAMSAANGTDNPRSTMSYLLSSVEDQMPRYITVYLFMCVGLWCMRALVRVLYRHTHIYAYVRVCVDACV